MDPWAEEKLARTEDRLARTERLVKEVIELTIQHTCYHVTYSNLVEALTDALTYTQEDKARYRAYCDKLVEEARAPALATGWPQVAAWAYTVLVHRIKTDDEPAMLVLRTLMQAGEAVGIMDESYSERVRLMNELAEVDRERKIAQSTIERLEAELAEARA